jgi:hypothetical protein
MKSEDDLQQALIKHALWYRTGGGNPVSLTGVHTGSFDFRNWLLNEIRLLDCDFLNSNFSDMTIHNIDLRNSYLLGSCFQKASVFGSNFSDTVFSHSEHKTIFNNAVITSCNFTRSLLQEVNFEGAIIRSSDFKHANLRAANLKNANLFGSDFLGATLTGANLKGAVLPVYQICPQEGDFIGWKKVQDDIILKLLITGKRTSSLVGRKCRCSAAKVLAALNTKRRKFYSRHDGAFSYTVGKTVSVLDYNDDIRVECAPGIHFFMTQEEAINY